MSTNVSFQFTLLVASKIIRCGPEIWLTIDNQLNCFIISKISCLCKYKPKLFVAINFHSLKIVITHINCSLFPRSKQFHLKCCNKKFNKDSLSLSDFDWCSPCCLQTQLSQVWGHLLAPEVWHGDGYHTGTAMGYIWRATTFKMGRASRIL